MTKAYYNEWDKNAAAWLRELIKAGLIADGDVDERSICDVQGRDLEGYTQIHWFAGIGGWSYALRLAGWPDDRPVWTGSCPCQPFSTAGKHKGQADERHLWPEMYRLIQERQPITVFGEQVANAIGKGWLDGVFTDLEAEGYSCGAAVLGAHSIGAPHIRQRCYWLANSECWPTERHGYEMGGAPEEMQREARQQRVWLDAWDGKPVGGLDNTITARLEGHAWHGDNWGGPGWLDTRETRPVAKAGAWSDFYLVQCRDGKQRRVKSGLCVLADGVPGRVGLLRGYGNAIVPQVAAEFIAAYMDVMQEASI